MESCCCEVKMLAVVPVLLELIADRAASNAGPSPNEMPRVSGFRVVGLLAVFGSNSVLLEPVACCALNKARPDPVENPESSCTSKAGFVSTVRELVLPAAGLFIAITY